MSVTQNLTLTETQVDNDVNMSDVTIKWTSTQSGESWNGYQKTAYYYVSINGGAETKYSVSYILPQSSTATIVNKTITVPHKDDGTATVKVRTWMDTEISAGVIELNKSLTLTTILRATTLDSVSCGSAYFTGKLTYVYTPKSSNLYNRCNISLNLDGTYIAVKTINLGKKSATQQIATVTLSDNERYTIYNKLPSTTSGVLRFTFRTYKNSDYSEQVGDASYKEISLKIPDTAGTKPYINISIEHSSTAPSPFDSLYLLGKSSFKATVTASGSYGAKIRSCKLSFAGVSRSGVSTLVCEGLYPASAGVNSFNASATDSRGFTVKGLETVTILPYSRPMVKNVSAERCDKNGNITAEGTYLKIKAKRSYSPVVVSGTQKNFCQIRYRYKLTTASSYSSWVTILAKNAESDEVETGALLNGNLTTTNSYIVQVQAIDDVGDSATMEVSLPTGKVYMHRDGARNSLAFGGYVEEDNTFSIAEGITFKVKQKSAEDVVVSDTGWVSLGLSDYVIEREESAGRIGKGCYYRVLNGNHVYVAFCCQLSIVLNTGVIVNKDLLPEEFRPPRHIYQLCIADNRTVARCKVRNQGDIMVDWAQILSSGSATSSYEVSWIDGYIDYFI